MPRFFKSPAGLRSWLAKNHARARELLVGFHSVKSGRGGMTYPEALDEALCYGWIDGVRRRLDAQSYSIRFSPRKKDSIWSAVNLHHAARLEKAGRMAAPGLARANCALNTGANSRRAGRRGPGSPRSLPGTGARRRSG